MAKPEHTAYQIQVVFSNTDSQEILAIDDDCINSGKLRPALVSYKKAKSDRIQISTAKLGHISFGYSNADTLLKQVRMAAKEEFSKGERPSFFLRKLTMSEFMTHENFKNYKNNSLIKILYKKYLLMDLLK